MIVGSFFQKSGLGSLGIVIRGLMQRTDLVLQLIVECKARFFRLAAVLVQDRLGGRLQHRSFSLHAHGATVQIGHGLRLLGFLVGNFCQRRPDNDRVGIAIRHCFKFIGFDDNRIASNDGQVVSSDVSIVITLCVFQS